MQGYCGRTILASTPKKIELSKNSAKFTVMMKEAFVYPNNPIVYHLMILHNSQFRHLMHWLLAGQLLFANHCGIVRIGLLNAARAFGLS
jgi:hypothetical protein